MSLFAVCQSPHLDFPVSLPPLPLHSGLGSAQTLLWPPSQVDMSKRLSWHKSPLWIVASQLLHVRLYFLTQLMLLRSWRMPPLQSACHKLKANSNDTLPSQPVPAIPLPPRRPPKHHYCFIQGHITVQCLGQCKEHGTFNNLLCWVSECVSEGRNEWCLSWVEVFLFDCERLEAGQFLSSLFPTF